MSRIFALVRTLVWGSLFVAFLLIYVPLRTLAWSGVSPPATLGLRQATGLLMSTAGAAIALWCVLAFPLIGRGTPAPFDPPRHLVVRGPYRLVRNPMYVGAGLFLLGWALAYGALWLAVYVALLWIIVHAFVVFYEEPTLAQRFGEEYAGYRTRVRRWLPRRPST